jgi:hypothetical protein
MGGTDLNRGAKSSLEPDLLSQPKACVRRGNSGGSWEPNSKKEFGLQENFEQTTQTFCRKSLFCCESQTLLALHLFVLCLVITECVNHTQISP